MSGEQFAPEATFAKITYTGAGPRFLKTNRPEIRPASQHCGNASDATIHHPKLGQVETGGDRFGAILKAAGQLHALQSGTRFAFEMRQRCERTRLAPVNYPDDDPWIFGGR